MLTPTAERGTFFNGIQKFYYSILRRKMIYRNLYIVYYIPYLLEVKDMNISVTYNFYQNWNKKRSLIDDWFWIPIYIHVVHYFSTFFFRDTYSLNACIVCNVTFDTFYVLIKDLFMRYWFGCPMSLLDLSVSNVTWTTCTYLQ